MAKFNLGNGNDRFTGTNSDDEIYGNGGADTINAADGNDFVNGGIGDDSIAGGRGNDWLLGGEGNDTLNGEDGDDTLKDQAGNDTYYGGNHNDSLEGGFGNDHLYGGSGHDTLKLVGDGHAWMYGGTGNDIYDLGSPAGDSGWELPSIYENAGEGYDKIVFDADWASGWGELLGSYTMPANVEELQLTDSFSAYGGSAKPVYGNEIDNVITGTSLADVLHGGKGNDTLVGNGGGDDLYGDEGNDTLIVSDIHHAVMVGGLNDDTYVIKGSWASFDGWQIGEFAGQGYDTLQIDAQVVTMPAEVEGLVLQSGDRGAKVWGNAIANLVNGTTGVDEIHGGGGNDTLYGYAGNDSLIGDAGYDLLVGDKGIDSLVGGSGNDVLSGGADADDLWGGDGNDRLEGDDGNDVLHGDLGADQLYGGAGADLFAFGRSSDSTMFSGVDKIMDFLRGVDSIDLHALDADSTSAGLQNFHWVAAFSGHAGELRAAATSTGVSVYGDTNGDGAADLIVSVVGVSELSLADFIGVTG